MSVAAGMVLLMVASPLAGAVGYLEVAMPARLFGLSARFSRWGLHAFGLDSSAVKGLSTPISRRLFGDPATLLDRACDDPGQFRLIIIGIRLQGIFFLLCSAAAAVSGAAIVVGGQ